MSIFSENTPNLSLPYIMPSQAQKHVTHNEAIRTLDALVQISVRSRTEINPPTSAENGDRFVIAANAVDEWADRDGQLATFQDGAWQFHPPRDGWIAWVEDESELIIRTSGNWIDLNSLGATGSSAHNANLLINGDFQINQREFSGGTLPADEYGYDRWKAGPEGAELTVSNGIASLPSGKVSQVLETPQLAGKQVTLSVEELSGSDLEIEIESLSAIIPQGAGRVGITLTVPSSSVGNITISLSPASGVAQFARVKLEVGNRMTQWSSRAPALEFMLAQRYYERLSGQSDDRYIRRSYGNEIGPQYYPIQFFAKKRVAPSVNLLQVSNSNSSDAQAFNASFYEFEFYHNLSSAGGYTYFGYEADAEL